MFIHSKYKHYPFFDFKNFKSWYSKTKRHNKTTLGLKGGAYGRCKLGRILVHSKGSVKSRIIQNIMSNTFKGFFYLSFLVQIRFEANRNGIIGLFNNSLGCWFNSLLANGFFLFDYVKLFRKQILKKSNKNNFYTTIFSKWPSIIKNMPPHSKICSIEIVDWKNKKSNGIKLVKSAGCRALLINNKYRINFSIVILPSLAIKLISNSSVAFFHFVENQSYKFFKSKKAGYYKNYGNKPTVRGVAKNPCDHPNGGRTKTILLSRTPWGKIAKKSRKMSLIKNFKIISKRLTREKKGLGKKFIVNIFNNDSMAVKFLSKSWLDTNNK